MVTIHESGMAFGPFADEDVFRVETCETYKRIANGVQIAEFMVIRDAGPLDTICIVEAKSSSPRAVSPEKFNEFILEIRDKLLNAMSLLLAHRLGRHPLPDPSLSDKFRNLDYRGLRFRFVLIVRDHKDEWLVPIQEALGSALNPTIRTWAIATPAVLVFNEPMARKYRLIRPSAE